MKPTLKQLIIILAIQAAGMFLWVFLTRSEADSSIFLWFSKSRLALVAIAGGIVLVLALAVKRRQLVDHLADRVERQIIDRKKLITALLICLMAAGLLSAFVFKNLSTPLVYSAYETWAPNFFPALYAIILNLLPFLTFLIVFFIDLAVFLVIVYWKQFTDSHYWSWQVIGPTFIASIATLGTLAYWVILSLRLKVLVNLPGWYWIFIPRSFSIRYAVYIFGIVCLIGLTGWLILKKNQMKLALAVIFVTGWAMQLGIGFLSGDRLQSFTDRYFKTYHAAYPKFASSTDAPLITNIRNYEKAFPNTFTLTKPPGLMTLYSILERIVNGNPAHSGLSDETRYERFSNAITGLFPAFGALAALILFGFSKKLLDFQKNWQIFLPAILYIATPSVVLFSLFADQAFYPAAFLLGAWVVFSLLKKDSLLAALLTGIILYLFIFFAFTMLPLYPVAAIFLALNWWGTPGKGRLISQSKKGIALLIGTAVAYGLFRWALNYDFFARISQTMSINHQFDFYLRLGLEPIVGSETLVQRMQQIFHALWLNNLEFATTLGIPIYILFILFGLRLVVLAIKRQLTPENTVLTSMFVAFIVLNLAGSALGEVSKLWIFWVPLAVMLAAKGLIHWFNLRPLGVLGILFIQVVTLLLTYHYQDLLMSA